MWLDADKFDDGFQPDETYARNGITLVGGGACPEQYEAYDELGVLVGYLRLRHGKFSVQCPDVGGEEVFYGKPMGDGLFEDHERDEWLNKAIASINSWLCERNLQR